MVIMLGAVRCGTKNRVCVRNSTVLHFGKCPQDHTYPRLSLRSSLGELNIPNGIQHLKAFLLINV